MAKKEDIVYTVNVDGPIAVYVQIENQIKFAIASGRLEPGDTLPSVREMSLMMKVNPNTVTKAYRDLEVMGLVETRRGVGVTVTSKAPRLCKAGTRQMVQEHLYDAVAECVAAGFSTSDVRDMVSDALSGEPVPYMVRKIAKR